MARLYDLIDADENKMVLTAKTQKFINEYLGKSIGCIAYARGLYILNANGKRYKILVSGECPKEKQVMIDKMGNSFIAEWEAMQAMFKNVKWVKHWDVGVKQLSVRR